MHLINIFTTNLLPVILLAGMGFLFSKYLPVDSRTLGRLVFYILSPILVFDLLTRSNLAPGSVIKMMAFATCIILFAGILAFLAGRLLHLQWPALMAVVLTSMIGNNGNYGFPVIAFAFGEEALAYATIYFVTSVILLNTVGVFIASLGHLQPRKALLGLLKVPALYAILLGMLMMQFDITFPDPLQKTIDIASGAAIPCMLFLLGMELHRADLKKSLGAISIPVLLRLVIMPAISIFLAGFFQFQPNAGNAGITEAGMPTAVMTTVVASEYGLDPALVTAIIFTTTILSPITLTVLLFYLGV